MVTTWTSFGVTDEEMRFARQALQIEIEQMSRDSSSAARMAREGKSG